MITFSEPPSQVTELIVALCYANAFSIAQHINKCPSYDVGNLPDDKKSVSYVVGNLPDDKKGVSYDVGNLPDDKKGVSYDVGNLPDDKKGVSYVVGRTNFNRYN
ncbi:MAG: hypothetical protein LBD91_05670 [Prevotellaceae bacterium]|nr:hypothetical protein [Prevotellaceae bacterium]